MLIKKQQKYLHYLQAECYRWRILTYDQSSVIEQYKFAYSSFGKALKKVEDQGRNQVEALKVKTCWATKLKINWRHLFKRATK